MNIRMNKKAIIVISLAIFAGLIAAWSAQQYISQKVEMLEFLEECCFEANWYKDYDDPYFGPGFTKHFVDSNFPKSALRLELLKSIRGLQIY